MREGSVSVHRRTERIVVQTGTVGYSIHGQKKSNHHKQQAHTMKMLTRSGPMT